MARVGDIVVYTQPHYLWLQAAGRWPNKHAPRRQYTGDIIDTDDSNPTTPLARIKWRFGSASWHFACNVEVRS